MLSAEVFRPEGDNPAFRLAWQLVVESCRLAGFQEAPRRLPGLRRQDDYRQVLTFQFHLIRSQLGAGQPAELQEGPHVPQGAGLPVITPGARRAIQPRTLYDVVILLSLNSPSS